MPRYELARPCSACWAMFLKDWNITATPVLLKRKEDVSLIF